MDKTTKRVIDKLEALYRARAIKNNSSSRAGRSAHNALQIQEQVLADIMFELTVEEVKRGSKE